MVNLASEVRMVVTPSQATLIEEQTRHQARSRLWFRMRSGCITASKFKAACQTDPCSPSHSLAMSICHPELVLLLPGGMKILLERSIFSTYAKTPDKSSVQECGFYVCTDYPFIGASPDGIVSCLCYGDGICEIKG